MYIYALMISPLLGVPGFPGMWELRAMLVVNASLQRCVCVCFLLCHNDDVAVATMHTGASAHAPSAMLNVRGHSSLLRNSGSQGLLGSGINPWEETAEACVASALANQHSSCSNLCRPVYNSQLVFLFFFVNPQWPDPDKGPGPWTSSGGEGDKVMLKCSVAAPESSLVLRQTNNVSGRLMRQPFRHNWYKFWTFSHPGNHVIHLYMRQQLQAKLYNNVTIHTLIRFSSIRNSWRNAHIDTPWVKSLDCKTNSGTRLNGLWLNQRSQMWRCSL